MTTQTQQPDALRLADSLGLLWGDSRIDEAINELRRQHTEITRLTAENEVLKSQLVKATTPPMTEQAWAEYCLSMRNETKADQIDLHAAIRQAVAAEREACAKACESSENGFGEWFW